MIPSPGLFLGVGSTLLLVEDDRVLPHLGLQTTVTVTYGYPAYWQSVWTVPNTGCEVQ